MRISKSYPYLLVAPAILLVIAVGLYPTVYSLYLSLTKVGNTRLEFVGLTNYLMIVRSPSFWHSVEHTLVYSASFIAITFALAFVLAMVFNAGLRFSGVYTTVIFLPWVLSEIVSGIMWRWMFLRDYGVLQGLLGPLFHNVTIILTPPGAMGVIVAASVWRSLAFVMLLILAGLQTIPRELTEAAAIDGASTWKAFAHITWPLVRPTTMVTLILLTIQAINAVGMVLAITDGGPGRATEVLSVHMYRQAIQYFHFGYGAAVSVLMLIANSALVAVYLKSLGGKSALATY